MLTGINKICIILFSMSIVISICAYTIGSFCLQLLYGLSFDKFRILFCVLVLAGTFNCFSADLKYSIFPLYTYFCISLLSLNSFKSL